MTRLPPWLAVTAAGLGGGLVQHVAVAWSSRALGLGALDHLGLGALAVASQGALALAALGAWQLARAAWRFGRGEGAGARPVEPAILARWIPALLAGAAVPIAAAGLATRLATGALADESLVAPVVSAAVAVSLVAGAIFAGSVAGLLGRLQKRSSRLARPGVTAGAAAGVIVVLAAVPLWRMRAELAALPLGRLAATLSGVGFLAGLLLALPRWRRGAEPSGAPGQTEVHGETQARPAGRRRALAALAGAVLLLGGTALYLVRPTLRAALAVGLPPFTTAMGVLAKLADRDGDGYAARPLGPDCDDRAGAVHPGAVDLPNNKVDEDCDGADLDPGALLTFPQGWANLPPELPAAHNLLLVTVDTLRADHAEGDLGARVMPALTAAAAGMVRFTRAYAPSSRSLRSIPAMLTGRYPPGISFGGEPKYPSFRPENRSIPELFAVAAAELDADAFHYSRYFLKVKGFLQGFRPHTLTDAPAAVRDLADGAARAEALTDRAIATLEARPEPARRFFAWVHYTDPHYPYADNARFKFGSSDRERYAGEVAFTDAAVGRLLAWLDKTGLTARTAVVIAADHGEEFGEHGNRFHGLDLYEDAIRVPLLVRAPGLAPRVIATPVSLVDVAPTIMNLLGLTRPGSVTVHGQTLVPLLTGGALLPRPGVFADLVPDGDKPQDLRAIVTDRFKLIEDVRTGTLELYDLAADPGERTNLRDADPARAAALRALLGAWRYATTTGSK